MMNKNEYLHRLHRSADYLVKNKYTSSNRLVIQGRSAGGLLMGAVTQHAS